MRKQTPVSSTASSRDTIPLPAAPQPPWSAPSLFIILSVWMVLQLGGLFSPGLLDDVDSIYIQIAREMLHRHDFVTPTIDGIRFFDKPPLLYWMAAGSMRVFGEHDWAARLPLALGVLGLLLAVYALGLRLYAASSPAASPDRGGLYAALAMATSIGPYLYTRFYIPDILIALWMTLSVLFLLQALDQLDSDRSALWPSVGFGAVTALNLLTKGLIGVAFPLATVFLFLALTHRLKLVRRLHVGAAALVFLLIAAPWHVLAALRNPAVAMPSGVGLPAHAGWAWFYLYNEHIARFLGRRIPHDYGQVPIPLFWLLLFLWLIPWAAFLPAALVNAGRALRHRVVSASEFSTRDTSVLLLLWAGVILGFFTLSSRQEYYHLPALPALGLLTGGLLAAADTQSLATRVRTGAGSFFGQTLRGSLLLLVPLGTCLFLVCTYFAITAPTPRPGVSLAAVLSSNPELYNLSLGHMFDLTGAAMGFFRFPLLAVGLGMLLLGPGSYLVRRRGHTFAANLLVATAMTVVLLAAHEGLVRFYPILGSKQLAQSIEAARKPSDRIIIDGELTAGSTLLFYTNAPVLLVNGHVNGPWFGSFWPDAPHIFLNDTDLARIWSGPERVYLLTYNAAQRTQSLRPFGEVVNFASAGGKTILTNRQ